MTIDRFSKSQFEAALPRHKETDEPLWECVGLVENEYEYTVPVNGTNKRIIIRSSIDRSGFAAECGKDSIRLWVEYKYKGGWHPLGKLDAWTTRVSGWERRVTEKLRELWQMALDDSKGHKSVGANEPKRKKQTNSQKADRLLAPTGAGGNPPETPHTPEIGSNPSPAPVFELGQVHSIETEGESAPPTNGPEPNEQQRAAIEAPVNAAVRVLAGPGAGKTFVVARRYSYLLSSGANPGDIIAVTFNKTMADELLARIIKVNPSVVGTSAENQVSTIHALCYRMLRAEGDKRRVAKEWQIKRTLQEIIEQLWHYPDDRPGYKEVLTWVNSIKMHGLTSADDLPEFSRCVDKFGRNVGRELHEARRRLDERMRRDGLLTFPDMLLDVEVRLKTDRAFREKWQAKFKWVIVDEAQDVSSQALRILITLSFDPPANPVYNIRR